MRKLLGIVDIPSANSNLFSRWVHAFIEPLRISANLILS
ncbi:hypothetical protein VPHD239_0084 [Vibrio phage D239]